MAQARLQVSRQTHNHGARWFLLHRPDPWHPQRKVVEASLLHVFRGIFTKDPSVWKACYPLSGDESHLGHKVSSTCSPKRHSKECDMKTHMEAAQSAHLPRALLRLYFCPTGALLTSENCPQLPESWQPIASCTELFSRSPHSPGPFEILVDLAWHPPHHNPLVHLNSPPLPGSSPSFSDPVVAQPSPCLAVWRRCWPSESGGMTTSLLRSSPALHLPQPRGLCLSPMSQAASVGDREEKGRSSHGV